MFEVFRLIGRIFLEGGDKVEQGLEGVEQQAASLGDRLRTLGKGLGAAGKSMTTWVTGPMAAAAGGAFLLAQRISGTADRLLDLHDITGMSTDSIQEWQHVSRIAGVGAEAVTTAVEGLVRRMPQLQAEGGRVTEQLQRLGLSFGDLERMAPDQMIDTLVSRLAAMEDPLERNAIGSALFGGAWKDMAPILALGTQGIAAARAEAHELGLVMGRESLESANEFRIAMERLKAQFGAVFNEIGLKLAPVIRDVLVPIVQTQVLPVLRAFGERVAALITWFGNLDTGWQRAILTAAGLLAALGPVLIVLGKVIGVVAGLTESLGRLKAAKALLAPKLLALKVALGPLGLALAAITLAGVAIIRNWATIRESAAAAWGRIRDAMRGPIDAITGIIDGIRSAAERAINWVRNLLGLNREAAATPAAPAGPRTAPAPAAPVPALQHGGIVTRPTLALVGERAPEAVLPLAPLQAGTARIEALLQAILTAVKAEPAPEGLGGLFAGATIQVRSDQDIERLSRELYRLHAARARAAGVTT